MKRIITIVFLLFTVWAEAQTAYLVQPAKWKFTRPQWLDSGAWIKNIPKYGGQERVLVYDSVTNKIGYKYISSGATYTAGRGLTLNSNVFRLDTALKLTWTANKTTFNSAPLGTAQHGLVNFGSGAFDGVSSGFFNSSASGTLLAGNLVSGSTSNLMDLQVGGSSKFKVDNTGGFTAAGVSLVNNYFIVGNPYYLATTRIATDYFATSQNLSIEPGSVSGSLIISAGSGMTKFNGTTSSFPALKRSTTSLEVKLADDSEYTDIVSKNGILSGVLFSQTSTATVANTTTETTVTSTGSGSLTLPANFFEVGKTLTIHAEGFHSATANPDITVKIKLGGTTYITSGTVVSGNSTNAYFEIKGTITCRTTGATGTVFAQGFFVETGGGDNHFGMPNTATQTIDTTVTNAIDVTVQWGTASANNTISITNLLVEGKN